MEIYKELSNPASKEFEQLLNSQFTKTANLEEGKIITGVVNKVTDNFVFLEVPGLKSEPILDINELKSMGMLDKAKVGEKISVLLERLEDKKIRKLVHAFQIKSAYYPPKKYNGSCLDGRDITYKIIPDADFKFFITANTKTRALRRYKELKGLNKKISFNEVLKSIKNRDKSDYNRKISPLKKTKDSVLINTTKHTKRSCFLKIKQIIDRKLKA